MQYVLNPSRFSCNKNPNFKAMKTKVFLLKILVVLIILISNSLKSCELVLDCPICDCNGMKVEYCDTEQAYANGCVNCQ